MFEQIELGDRVADPISGFKGIAHAITTWLNGCVRISIAPEGLDKEGKIQEDRYFDVGQLRVLDKGVFEPVVMAPKGGPARETSNFRPPSSEVGRDRVRP